MTYPLEIRALARGDSVPLRQIIDAYLRHSEANNVHCQEALEERKRVLHAFAEHCGWLPVRECKAFHLTDYIDSKKSWKSTATRRSKANAIRACFNWAVEQERIERNPFARVRYREGDRRPSMPDETIEAIAKVASKPFEHALRFLRYTGCRVGELCNARWGDMDLDKATWTIPRHKSRRYTGRPKLVALVHNAVLLLLAIQATPTMFPKSASDLVFTNNRGRQWTRYALGHTLNRIKQKYKINCPASLHGIRHRAASAAIVAGAPLKLVAEQLGHASTQVTEKYYCHLEGQIDAVRSAFERGMRRNE